jgi:hypothetical protein
MKSIATWQHLDGSVVEFSENGRKSTDTEINNWLRTISNLGRAMVETPPVIKPWLGENCQLVDFQGSQDFQYSQDLSARRWCQPQPETGSKPTTARSRAINKAGRPNSSKRSLQLGKRRIVSQFILIRDKRGA